MILQSLLLVRQTFFNYCICIAGSNLDGFTITEYN